MQGVFYTTLLREDSGNGLFYEGQVVEMAAEVCIQSAVTTIYGTILSMDYNYRL